MERIIKLVAYTCITLNIIVIIVTAIHLGGLIVKRKKTSTIHSKGKCKTLDIDIETIDYKNF